MMISSLFSFQRTNNKSALKLSSHALRSLQQKPTASIPKIAFSSIAKPIETKSEEQIRQEHLAFHHFTKEKPKPKFKSPRKRASKLLYELQNELVIKSIKNNPSVLKVPFKVGDAVEIKQVTEGGIKSKRQETIRGIVMGRENKSLNTAIYVRCIKFGEPIEYKLPLHSPLIRSLKVLGENYLFKGKKPYCKRAKLYYLRDRNPELFRIGK